jgi:hypothetical protein
VGRLVCVGIGVAVALGMGVAVGASVGAAVAMGVAAGPQAERKKAKNKNRKRVEGNDNFTTKGTKFRKGILKTLCGPLSLVCFASACPRTSGIVLKNLLSTWPIQ